MKACQSKLTEDHVVSRRRCDSHQCDAAVIEVVPFVIILRFNQRRVVSVLEITNMFHYCVQLVHLILFNNTLSLKNRRRI